MREYISGTIIGISRKMLFGQAWRLRPVGDQRWGHGGLRVKWLFFGVDIVHHSDLAAEIITCDGEDHGCEPNLTPFRIGGVAGILDFLWNLNQTVAIPIAITVGFSLVFLLWTTVLPAMQAVSLLLPRWPWVTKPRSPCPYKSPQSWAFYQLLRPLVAILLNTSDHTNIEKSTPWGHYGLASHSMTLEKDRELHCPRLETTSRRQRRPANLIFRHEIGDSWAKMGIAWLFQRDLDFMRQNTMFKESGLDQVHRPVPVFDTVKALIDVGANGSPRDVLLAQDCIELVVHANKSDLDYMNLLSVLVDLDDFFDDSQAKEIPLNALTHHNTLFFYRKIVGSRRLEGVLKLAIEPFANITHTLMDDGAKPLVDNWLLPWCPLRYFDFGSHPGEHKS